MATTFRFSGLKNKDNTGRRLSFAPLSPAYAASIAIDTAGKTNTIIQVAQLTGNLSMTIGVGTSTTDPYVGDECLILFSADGTNRVVTFSTGFETAGTLTVTASKKGSARFVFNGTAWQEVSRAVTA